MVSKVLVVGLLIAWLTVLITGCAGKEVSSFPLTSTPPPTTAPQSTILPTPHPTASPGQAEGKPTPPGGEKPFVLPPAATLPPLDTSWQEYEVAEVGLRIQMPAEWEVLRMPGGYIFAADGEYRAHVTSCCIDLPRSLPEFQEALGPYLRSQHEEDFTITPMKGARWEGVGVWYKSNPNVCLTVYIPSPEIVRQITFFDPAFCEADGERLAPLGERILSAVEILPLRTQ